MDFSIVIPLYNEEENIKILLSEIFGSLNNTNYNYEIILINDASTDNTLKIINQLKEDNNRVKVISNSTNLGQSLSICEAVKRSVSNTIVTIDGDGQNNPSDIKNLLEKYVKSDYSLVAGIRVKRKDSFLKKFSSKIANKIRMFILNDNCIDTGCSLKIFDKKIFLKFPKFKGLHRFMPALFIGYGTKISFVEVDHRYRKAGKSKYGTFDRLIYGIIDLIRVIYIIKKIK